MDKTKMREQALEILKCDTENLEEKELPDIKAMYFRVTKRNQDLKELPDIRARYFRVMQRGEESVIIAENGDMLFNSGSMDYEEHLKEFLDGLRSLMITTGGETVIISQYNTPEKREESMREFFESFKGFEDILRKRCLEYGKLSSKKKNGPISKLCMFVRRKVAKIPSLSRKTGI